MDHTLRKLMSCTIFIHDCCFGSIGIDSKSASNYRVWRIKKKKKNMRQTPKFVIKKSRTAIKCCLYALQRSWSISVCIIFHKFLCNLFFMKNIPVIKFAWLNSIWFTDHGKVSCLQNWIQNYKYFRKSRILNFMSWVRSAVSSS